MALLDEYAGALSNAEASHLLRRAAFGGDPAQRSSFTGMTASAAVSSLVNIQPTDPYLDQPGTPGTGTTGDPFADLPDAPADPNNPTALESDLIALKAAKYPPGLRGHWLYRMRYSSQPFQEMFTLFLHDHMPSDVEKIVSNIPNQVNFGNDGDPMGLLPPGDMQACDIGAGGLPYDPFRKYEITTTTLRDQNYLYREDGLDRFEDLLVSVIRDPAMMSYLDNFLNVKGRPQENLARELMELFSLGVGNYNENDIQQIAKCLTGESFPNFSCPNSWDASYGFIPERHELGDKFIFGGIQITFDNTGQETEQVVQRILAKQSVVPNVALPGAAVYIAWKLCRWFVNENIQLDPADPIVTELAAYLAGDDAGTYPDRRYPYDIKAAMGKLLRSQFFYDPNNFFAIHKNPADYLVGALRGLNLPEVYVVPGGLQTQMRAMGMDLFQPPNVAGWVQGTSWLGAASLIARYNWANRLAHGVMNASVVTPLVDAYPVSNNDHGGMAAYFADALLHESPTAEETTHLTGLIDNIPLTGLGGDTTLEKRRKIQGLVHVLLTMPKIHLK